jgi:hypothetical protein
MATAPWTAEQLAATIARGPHKSAIEYAEFLGEELREFVLKVPWIVLPYHVVQNLPKKVGRQLRISPMGVVPQQERRPRVIVDYSFFGVMRHVKQCNLERLSNESYAKSWRQIQYMVQSIYSKLT